MQSLNETLKSFALSFIDTKVTFDKISFALKLSALILDKLLETYKDVIMMSGHTHLTFYENENYSEFLEQYTIMQLVKKYSDFIRYPIRMMWETNKLKDGSDSEFEKVLEERTLKDITSFIKPGIT